MSAGRAARWQSVARRVMLGASVVGLLLFPAAIMRSHQQSGNYVRISNLLAKEHLAQHRDALWDIFALLDEGRIRSTDGLPTSVLTPRGVRLFGCVGPYVVVDTPQFWRLTASVAGRTPDAIATGLDQLDLSTFYSNGSTSLKSGHDCLEFEGLLE